MVVTFDDPWSNPENPSRVVVTCLARTSEDRVDDDLFCWKDILRTEWSLAQINAGRPEIERAA
ncbi:hypothetical protein ASF30_11015 [Leifsonia sp. Leaf264]|nr:hypothetical protein ASF30_11015 [Leifsonia sp. Leaf264]